MSGSILLLKDRNILCLWLGQVLSQAGTRMYQIALAWWILSQETSQSGVQMGALLVMGALPGILFAKKIGAWLDRYPTRKMLLLSDLLAGAGGLALFFWVKAFGLTLVPIYLAGFLFAFCQAILDPGINKLIPSIVPPAQVEAAVGFLSTMNSLASFFGAMAGAFVLSSLGTTGVIVANFASYFLAALATSAIRPVATADADQSTGSGGSSPESEKSGFEILKEEPVLFELAVSFGLLNFFLTPILISAPVFVKKVLLGNAQLLAWTEAGIWLGLVAGAMVSSAFKFDRRFLSVGAWSLLSAGVFLFLSATATSSLLFVTILALFGAAIGNANAKFLSLFQSVVPAEKQGRFFAILFAFTSGSFPIAFLVFGFLSDILAATTLLSIQGLGMTVLSLRFLMIARKEAELWA